MKYYMMLLKKFFSLKAYDKRLMRNLLILIIARALVGLTIPLVSAAIIDAATEGNFQQAIVYVIVFAADTTLYVSLARSCYSSYAKNSLYIHDTLQRKILDKIPTLDQDYTKKMSRAEIINTCYADVTKCQRIPDYLFSCIVNIGSMIVDAIILVFVDPLIGAITLGLTIISMILFIFHMRKRDYYSELRRVHQDEISSLYNQMIDGHKEVHAFNLQESLHTIIEKERREWKKIYLKQRVHNDIGQSLTPLLQGIGRIITYLIASALILKGEYNVATLILVIGYYENMHESYDKSTDIIYELSKSNVAINRVYRLLNYTPSKKITFGANDNDNIKGEVSFKHVSFAYGRKRLLRNITFKLVPHSLTGIVGKSGSGKSTIFRLLLRLYRPTSGTITIDGSAIDTYTKDVYAANVSLVSQKPFVFDMSIKDNLSLVDSNTENQVAACKKVGIHDYIMRLEKGYNTILTSDGSNMSAGHKQLLSLARTLLSKSEVLLFDEVTSTLDINTTKQIIKVLKELKKDHTVIVITHKPEVMRSLDELIVIDHGKIVGRGTHQKLAKNKFYKLLQK